MINANDWLEKRSETFFDESFCHIKCLVIVAHLFWHHSRKGQFDPMPGYEAKLTHLLGVRDSLIARNGCWSGFIITWHFRRIYWHHAKKQSQKDDINQSGRRK